MLESHIRFAQIVLPCPDLAATLDFFTARLGFKVSLIMPADAPAVAVISAHGLTLRLEQVEPQTVSTPVTVRLLCDLSTLPPGAAREMTAPGGARIVLADALSSFDLPQARQEFVLTRMKQDGRDHWGVGRAGMQYRDLIPSRLGGRFVASHIRIPVGGPVPDYVHFHKIRFQMIYCKTGWAKLVYEDQGEPFMFNAGDCVLQPPEIRHRVLEASAGLEVIEIGCPAIHETFADHNLPLPTPHLLPHRDFSGQCFVRHEAGLAQWRPWRIAGFEARDTGIGSATEGLAGVQVVRPVKSSAHQQAAPGHGGELLFFFVLDGEVELASEDLGDHRLQAGDSCVIPAGAAYTLRPGAGLELLEVTLPAALPAAQGANSI